MLLERLRCALIYMILAISPIGHLHYVDYEVIIFFRYILALSLIAVFFISNKSYIFYKPFLSLLLITLSFIVFHVISTLYNNNFSFGVFLSYIFVPIFLLSVYKLNFNCFKKVAFVFVLFVFVSTVYILLYMMGIIPRPNEMIAYPFYTKEHDQFYLMGLGRTVEHSTMDRSIAAMLGIWLLRFQKNKYIKNMLIGVILLLITHVIIGSLYLGNGRSSVLMLFLTLFIYMFHYKKKYFLSLLSISIVTILFVTFSSISRVQISDLSSISGIEKFTSGRLVQNIYAWEMVKSNPITGIGAGNFTKSSENYRSGVVDIFNKYSAHEDVSEEYFQRYWNKDIKTGPANDIVLIMAEEGIFVGGMYVCMWILLIIILARVKIPPLNGYIFGDIYILFSILLASFFISLISGGLPFDFYFHIWWWFILGVSLKYKYIISKGKYG